MLTDTVVAALKESESSDLREIVKLLSARHGAENVALVAALNSSAGETTSPFQRGFLRASELPDAPKETPRIWFGLYPGALVYICGETGAGKSSVLYNIVIHAARNEPLWGVRFGLQRPLNVLYIDPENSGNFDEMNGGLCSEKVERIGQGKPNLLIFHDGDQVNLSLAAHFAELEEYIVKEKIDLLVLDPIINLFATRDENDNAEAARHFHQLKALCKRTGVCVIAVHHTGRDGSGIFGRGATARLGASDVGIMLRVRGENEDVDDDFGQGALHDRQDFVRLQIVKNRREPGKASLFLQMAGQDRFCRVTFAEWKNARASTEPKPTKKERAEDEIYTFLADGEWHTTEEIRAAMSQEDIGQNATDKALALLARQGTIEKKKEGTGGKAYYRIPPAGDAETTEADPPADWKID